MESAISASAATGTAVVTNRGQARCVRVWPRPKAKYMFKATPPIAGSKYPFLVPQFPIGR